MNNIDKMQKLMQENEELKNKICDLEKTIQNIDSHWLQLSYDDDAMVDWLIDYLPKSATIGGKYYADLNDRSWKTLAKIFYKSVKPAKWQEDLKEVEMRSNMDKEKIIEENRKLEKELIQVNRIVDWMANMLAFRDNELAPMTYLDATEWLEAAKKATKR